MDDLYKDVLKSYEENPKVQILRKIRGKAAAAALLPDQDIHSAKGFVYVRQLRKTARIGFKLVVQRSAIAEPSVIGQEQLLENI
jgi:hypothetical protein